MEQLLYIHRVAKLLDCSRPMVYKLIYEGKLKAVRIGKRGLRISKPSLEEFIEINTIEPNEFFDIHENYLHTGDIVVIPLNSKEYNELKGSRLIVTSVNDRGIYGKKSGEKGNGVFIPYGYFNVPKDNNCDIHGK